MGKEIAPKEDEIGSRTLPDLEFDESTLAEGNGGAKAGPNPELTALQTEIAALQADLKKQQEANMALMAMPVATVAPTAPKDVSYEGLPDATMDPDGFGKELARRIEANQAEKQTYNQAISQTEAQRNNKLQALWEDFTIQHGDYAEDPDQVEFAVTKVLKRANQRGIDPDRYMFGHTDTFMGDVVKEIDALRGGAGEDPEPKPSRKARTNRTDGMLGGIEGGGKPSKAAPALSDMYEDIRKFQRTSGFY